MKNDNWVFYDDVEFEKTAEGVKRKILAYPDPTDFEKGRI